MKTHWSEILYLVKNDNRVRRQFKKLLLLGCLGITIIVILLIVAGSFFINPIISFITTNFPIVNNFLFSYARGFLSSFMMEDLLNSLSTITNNANVAELKGLILKYFDQLKNNSSVDFQSFQNFISTIKNIVGDGQINSTELESLRKLIPN